MSALAADAVVLAHGGGAPEAAMIGLPVLVLAVFAVLERRARRREAEQEAREPVEDRETGDARALLVSRRGAAWPGAAPWPARGGRGRRDGRPPARQGRDG